MSAPTPQAATSRVATAVGVGGARHLLDDAALSALLGREVRISHVRLKPGRSVQVAWSGAAPGSNGAAGGCTGWGWAEATNDPDKAAKALLRGELAGETVTVREVEGSSLLWGGLHTDRNIAKDLVELQQAFGPGTETEVLRYNPGKRVVARISDAAGTGVLRVSPSTGQLLTASALWAGIGAPTLVPDAVGGRGTASRARWWGVADLHRAPEPGAARAAGRAVGAVHRESTLQPWPGEVATEPALEVTAAGLVEVAPWLTSRISRLVRRLQPLLGELAETGPVWLHGDLSPDQVIHDGTDEIRLIDLDRATTGPAALDVGSWLAACRAGGLDVLVDPFLAGHAEHMPVIERSVTIAEALAQFRAAIDPFRKLWPDWPAAITERIGLTESALRRIP